MSQNNIEDNSEENTEEKENNTENRKEGEGDDEDEDIEFRENLDKYTQIDDLIKVKKDEIKVLNEDKKVCEEIIIDLLVKKDVEYATWKNSKISRVVTKTRPAITGDILKKIN